MTSISNVNIILQQESGAREAQHTRHPANDQNHVLAANQKEKDIQHHTTVQQSDQSEKTKPEKDPSDDRKRKRRGRSSRRQPTADSDQQRHAGDSGKLVNTVA